MDASCDTKGPILCVARFSVASTDPLFTRRILENYRQRNSQMAPIHAKMGEISTIYANKMKVPLADMDRTEESAVPNLLAQGIDQMGARIASTTPTVTFSPDKPGQRASERNASAASNTLTGWWQTGNRMLKQEVQARRLVGYAIAPMQVCWDHEKQRPYWHERHPMQTFPPTDLDAGKVVPNDVYFCYYQSVGWCVANGYEAQIRALGRVNSNQQLNPNGNVKLIEYINADETVLMATGYYAPNSYYSDDGNGQRGVVLERYDNPAGMPVVIPHRISLDSLAGQFDTMIGMYKYQAKLMALEQIGAEKDIFPDIVMEGRTNEMPELVNGQWADGRTGEINITKGGVIKLLQGQANYQPMNILDRVERASRMNAGLPLEFGGESGTNVRTARRGDSILSAVIDYTIAEAQNMFAIALEAENEICIKMAKHYAGGTSKTIYVGVGNSRRPVTYIPNKTFSHYEHVVAYPITGADANTASLLSFQKVGAGLISKETAREQDPTIADPEGEHDRIIKQGLEEATMAALQQQVVTGQLTSYMVGKIAMDVNSDKKEIWQAVVDVTEEAMRKQQEQAQASGPPTQEGQVADQTAQQLAGIPPIQPQAAGMANLNAMLGASRRQAMPVNAYQGSAQGAV